MSITQHSMSHSDTHQPGVAQLDRYLARCWRSAGIRESRHQDCHQSVYLRLLEQFGRDRLDVLLDAAERDGLHAALDWAPVSGPDFFRAIDAVKKRVSRERGLMSLDVAALSPASDRSAKTVGQRAALEGIRPAEPYPPRPRRPLDRGGATWLMRPGRDHARAHQSFSPIPWLPSR